MRYSEDRGRCGARNDQRARTRCPAYSLVMSSPPQPFHGMPAPKMPLSRGTEGNVFGKCRASVRMVAALEWANPSIGKNRYPLSGYMRDEKFGGTPRPGTIEIAGHVYARSNQQQAEARCPAGNAGTPISSLRPSFLFRSREATVIAAGRSGAKHYLQSIPRFADSNAASSCQPRSDGNQHGGTCMRSPTSQRPNART